MRKVGIGMIGCGGRLRGVAQHLFNATDQVEVRAVHDTNPESVKATLEQFNPAAVVCDSVEALLGQSGIDWVMIGTWNCFHAEQVIKAFEAGKHVFCEKPLALTVEDCLAMREAWTKSGKQFTIGFTLRYSPHYVKIQELVASGAIGKVLSMEFNETLEFNHGGYIHADWRRKTAWAGSHLLEKCCHDLDLVNWILGSFPVKAASFGGCDFFTSANSHYTDRLGNKDGKKAFQTWSHEKIAGNVMDPFNDDKDIVDNQVAIMQYANGVRTTFHTNCNCGIPERRMYICGTEGTIRADVITGKIELRKIGFDAVTEDHSTSGQGGHGGGDEILGQSLAASMLEGTAPRSTLEDGLRSAIAAFGIDRALESGTVFDLTPMLEQAGLLECASV